MSACFCSLEGTVSCLRCRHSFLCIETKKRETEYTINNINYDKLAELIAEKIKNNK